MDSFTRFQSILTRLSGTPFTAKLGEFYRGETAVLRAIEALIDSTGSAHPSTLAAYLQITRPSVTSALSSLERKGHITRSIGSTDRRRIEVSPTPKGRQKLKETAEEVDQWCSMMLQSMGENRFHTFLSIIEEGLDIMDIQE